MRTSQQDHPFNFRSMGKAFHEAKGVQAQEEGVAEKQGYLQIDIGWGEKTKNQQISISCLKGEDRGRCKLLFRCKTTITLVHLNLLCCCDDVVRQRVITDRLS